MQNNAKETVCASGVFYFSFLGTSLIDGENLVSNLVGRLWILDWILSLFEDINLCSGPVHVLQSKYSPF